MTTSSRNRESPSARVTPDCVIQLDMSQGIVAETKLGLSKNPTNWDQPMKQMQKYDDDLTGWWTQAETLDSHDVVALVPLARAVRFAVLWFSEQ